MYYTVFLLISINFYLHVRGKYAKRPIWQPVIGQDWQIILNDQVDNQVINHSEINIWDVDFELSNKTISTLLRAGKTVICYFSAGSFEAWRTDQNRFTSADLGQDLSDWPNEKWLRTDSLNVRAIMSDRIAAAAEMGCDGIDPDNVDGYVSSTHSLFINF